MIINCKSEEINLNISEEKLERTEDFYFCHLAALYLTPRNDHETIPYQSQKILVSVVTIGVINIISHFEFTNPNYKII